jgi:hypothetical protein
MTELEKLIKRLPGYIDTASTVLTDILMVILGKITVLNDEIYNASETNQTKKKLRQILKEYNIESSSVNNIADLQRYLRRRYEIQAQRGSENGILDDIEILCNSGANIVKYLPPVEWYLGINYPLWSDEEDSPLNYSDACYGYLIDCGIAIQFAVDNNLMTIDEIRTYLLKYSIPIHLNVIMDIGIDSYNTLMLEQHLGIL